MEQIPGLTVFIAVAGLALSLLAATHALLRKRKPEAAIGWIAFSFLLPYLGPALYFLFGVNRVVRLGSRLRGSSPHRDPAAHEGAEPPPAYIPLAKLGARISGQPLLAGNDVEVLHDGEQAYPAMLAAIDAAERSVYLASYIFDHDDTGAAFASALRAAVDRGVDVRVLLDGVGELYSWPRSRRLLRRSRVRVATFLPPTLLPPSLHLNLRNHRKILAVDGETAFSGGMNISDRHLTAREPRRRRVHDLHFRFRGPIAAQIVATFHEDWQFVTGEPAPEAGEYPSPAGTALCRAVADGPYGDLDRLGGLLVGAAAIARERLGIMTPYLLPPRALIGSLRAAAMRGVDVCILLPATNNLPYVHRATRHLLWELLEAGIDIRYQPGCFVHSKLLLVDDEYALVGSANIDPRSLRLNFELNVEIYDSLLLSRLWQDFSAARTRSRRVTLHEVDHRPLPRKILDGLAWLASPYL